MNSVGSLDPAVFAADSVEALAALRNAENEEACLQSERTSMPSQYDAVHIMPVGTPSNPSERSEMSATPLLLHNLQSVTTDSDLSAEELLRSFRDSAVPNTPTLKSGIAAKAAAFANSVSDPTMMFPTAMRPTNPDSTLDKNLSTTHRTPTMSPVPGLTVGQERPNHNADDGDKSRDRMMDVTPALRQRDIETTTAVSRSHTPSSEEVQVRLLQSKIQEATNYLQTLQVKADTLESEKERYEREAVKLAGDIDATDADVKDLQAQKKDIEAQRKILQTRKNAIEVKIKQKKADICGIEEAKTSVERHITAKFREHISANCEVDKAVKRQRDLEKQLIDAEYEARLVRECPDPDLRHFVRNTTEDAGSNQLIDDAITGEVTIIDLDQIEKMLEQAKEGTSDNFKPESVKSEHKEEGEQFFKMESVKVKTEHASTAVLTALDRDSSPTAQGLLDTMRQMRDLNKTLQAQLVKIKSLKRKRVADENENDGTSLERRAKPKYSMTETDSDADERTDNANVESQFDERNGQHHSQIDG